MSKEEIAKDLATVRRTGQANMFDRRAVVEILMSMDLDDTAEYIREHKQEYMDLLTLSGEF